MIKRIIFPTKQFQSRDQLEEIKETEKVSHGLGKKLANLNSHHMDLYQKEEDASKVWLLMPMT